MTFGYDPAGGLQVDNFLPEPVGPEDADDQRDYLSDILFPPLDSPRIAAILRQPIAGSTWQQDLDRATKYASGEQIANVMASGLSLGKNPREVAKELQSRLGVVQSSARRVARTYGVQVAHRAQMDCHQALGGLLVGYQIRATLDQHTRPWHAARSGTIYYLDPAPGQKGMAQCPHPPLEAEDPNERPPGAPKTSWNCLLPGNRVQGRFLRGFNAHYSGQAVQLTTALGVACRVTPNHPVLTPQGFVAADRLREGDYLACYIAGVMDRAEDEHDAPVPIEEVFGAIKALGGV
ncbi:MAG TPA: minor capsid protein, partial [Tepidisphaeraceae bacterium]|nr:minor capsid protein [Tepidisphaeraceae bacterium]